MKKKAKILYIFCVFLYTITAYSQNDTLISTGKGGKITTTDSATLPISISSKGGKNLPSDSLPLLAKADTLLKDTLLAKKTCEFPPTTDAAQRWEKKAYRRILQEFPKPIAEILTPLDTNRQDPNVAYKRALILPGWGQAYNRSYWKIPIVYAGLGGLGYWFYFNHQQYKTYQTAYRYATDGDSTTNPATVPNVNEQQIDQGYRALRDQYRRTRDQTVIFITAFYALQVVEAYTHAHLKYFDVDENLSVQVAPTFQYETTSAVSRLGIGVNFRF